MTKSLILIAALFVFSAIAPSGENRTPLPIAGEDIRPPVIHDRNETALPRLAGGKTKQGENADSLLRKITEEYGLEKEDSDAFGTQAFNPYFCRYGAPALPAPEPNAP